MRMILDLARSTADVSGTYRYPARTSCNVLVYLCALAVVDRRSRSTDWRFRTVPVTAEVIQAICGSRDRRRSLHRAPAHAARRLRISMIGTGVTCSHERSCASAWQLPWWQSATRSGRPWCSEGNCCELVQWMQRRIAGDVLRSNWTGYTPNTSDRTGGVEAPTHPPPPPPPPPRVSAVR